MLILSRKKNESIVINEDINVVVVDIRDDKVRLGIDHPHEIPVHRREVYEAIRRSENSEDFSASPEIKRKKADILAQVRAQLSNANDLEQLLELERKFR